MILALQTQSAIPGPAMRIGYGPNAAEFYAQLYRIPVSPRGMGALGQSSSMISEIATTGAATTVTILHALSIGLFASGPITAAIGGLIAVGGLIASMFHGCGQTCVVATQDANKIGALLDQNQQAYMSAPVHYKSLQQAALNNITTLMAALQQACGDPALGKAGQRCISERLVRRSCPSTLDDSNMGGGKIPFCDYYSVFYDPIANDPNVVPDPAPASSSGTAVSSTASPGAPAQASPGGSSSALLVLALGVIFVGAIL
jgi:hypothetical protein